MMYIYSNNETDKRINVSKIANISTMGDNSTAAGCNSQWHGERYDGTSTRTGPLQSKKIKNRIER